MIGFMGSDDQYLLFSKVVCFQRSNSCHDNVGALNFFFHYKTIPNRCKLFNFYPSF